MPLGPGIRYRVKTTSTGKKVRLAFKGKKKVVEAKNLKTGETHTEKEFREDEKGRRKRKGKKGGK